MKRGLSLVTSLMLTASVFGGAASQAFNYKNISVVSAADASPVIGIGNPAYNGITRVPVGSKKAVIPVIVTSSDMLTAIVDLEVTASKGANPTITGVSEVVKNITVNEAVSNERSFIWNAEGLKAPSIDGKIIANVEITFPDDAAKDSEYTLTIKSVDASDFAKTKGYGVDKDKSDYKEKIIFGAEAAEDYTLSFAENADSKWNPTKKITVKAGQTVPVGLEIQYPSDNIGAVVFDLDITDGAKVTGYEKGAVGEIDSSEANILNAVWTIPGKFNGYKFEETTHLCAVNVEIPKDAKPGSKYTLSMVKEDTSTGDKKTISSASLPSVELVVEDSEVVEPPVQGTIELEIKTVEVPRGTKTAQVPVYVKNGDATAIVAMFEAQLGAKVTAIEAADVEGDVSVGETSNLVIWNNKFTGKVTDHKFSAEGEKLLILTVELPDASDVTEYPVVFIEKELDVADANKVKVKTTIKNGAVKIIEPDVTTTPVASETTPAVTTTVQPGETTPAPSVTTTVQPGETTPAPSGTTPAVTTTVKPGETTPVPSETTPVVTTTKPVVTTGDDDINLDPDTWDDINKDLLAQIVPENYKPEFYYHHEEAFRLPEIKATLKLTKGTGDNKTEMPVALTDKNFKFADKSTPATVYDDTKFSYKAPLVLDIDTLELDAEVKTKLKAKGDLTIDLPVYIGQLGDYNLNHVVDLVDATAIKRERLSVTSENGSILESEILADNKAAKDELGKYTVDFAYFLGDAKPDNTLDLLDSTNIKKACLQRATDELKDLVHMPRYIWEKIEAIK